MILEEETFENFGYYPRNLKPHSHKQILTACDTCGIIRKSSKHNYHPLCHQCYMEDSRRIEKMRKAITGKKVSDETKRKMSEAHKGEKHWNYGNHHSIETRRKISKSNTGCRHSIEAKKKISDATKGKNNPNYGKIVSDEQKQKIRKAHIGMHLGERNPNWKGGITFEDYPKEFYSTKDKILKMHDEKCFLCGRDKIDNGREMDIHHINQNKKDNSVFNLIPLCKNCHSSSHNLVSQISLTNRLSYFLMCKEWQIRKDEC